MSLNIIVIDSYMATFNINDKIVEKIICAGSESMSMTERSKERKRKREKYFRECAEALKNFNLCDVIYIAGIGDAKFLLYEYLKQYDFQNVVKFVDVQYGQVNGYIQAIEKIHKGEVYDYTRSSSQNRLSTSLNVRINAQENKY